MTARNYLFAPTDADVELTRFIATAASVTGFMDGAPGGPLPGWHRLGRDNSHVLRTLYARVEQAYPAAGQPFYAVRLWTNLLWQPAYLSVIGVHVTRALPDLSTIAQAVKGNDISGYRLLPGPQYKDDTDALILRAGGQLRAMADAILAEINTLTRLKRLPALRLLTDRMLGLMLRLPHYDPAIGVAEQRRYCALWLEAMGLINHGDLETVELADGRQVLISANKGCCLDYLAFPDTYCACCPKQPDDVRRDRLVKNALAEQDS